MSKISLLLMSLWFCAAAFTVSAENPTGYGTPTPDKQIVLRHKGESATRPNAPARIYLVAYYNAEYIDFIFPDGVSEITVEFVSPDHPDRIFSGTATIDNVRVPMPDTGGSYDMTCVTDTGISFYGRISF